MALNAKQTQQQRLMLAPNVTLALEVLRMPLMELQTFLESQCEENPLLELDEELAEEQRDEPFEETSKDAREHPEDEEWSPAQRTLSETEDPENDDVAEDDRRLERQTAAPISLRESLLMQWGCQPGSPEDRSLGELLIHQLDEFGYLEGSLEEAAVHAGVELAHAEWVLKLIQRLDPPGVGARDLRECLMAQLEQAGEEQTLAYRIVASHFPLFVQQRVPQLAKATGASAAEVTQACERLKRLNPKPGRAFAGNLPPAIVPDLLIKRGERHDDVELNDQELPQIRISRSYYRMLRDPNTAADVKEFLATKFRQAGWLIRAVGDRQATLLAIGRCLISLQRDFLEHGPKALKPLTQAQVASLVGRHPSTVSRAIAGKTIDTPCGVFRLEQLFATNLPQNGHAEQVSDAQIKSAIQQLIDEEDPRRPLSDAQLVRHLAQRQLVPPPVSSPKAALRTGERPVGPETGGGIVVARRTIAKYRAQLSILPAHLRKRRL